MRGTGSLERAGLRVPAVGTRRGGAVPRIARFIPGIAAARAYERAWLSKDVVAGLVLTALLVPQGMAYAELAGLPAITGLYTSIMCLLAYAVFGPSRILVLGPDSSLGPMIAATILPLVGADGDPAKAIALASMLALMVGVCMIVAGVCRLGFVADLFSKPTQIGYMNGLALTILVGQLPKLFGFSIDADSFLEELTGFVRGVADGETVPEALAIGLAGLAIILVAGRRRAQGPWRAGRGRRRHRRGRRASTSAARASSLVGELPQGFPPFTLPGVELADLGAARGRRARHHPGVAHRHDLDLVGVRRPHRSGDRRRPGDDRHRRRQRLRRAVPGLPREHERVADRGGRAGGGQEPAHRRGRSAHDRRHAPARAGAVPEPAAAGAGGGGDLGIALARRHPRHGAPLEAAPDGLRRSRWPRSAASPSSASCPASPSRSPSRS